MSTYDPSFSDKIAEGQAPTANSTVKSLVKDSLPTFERMVVLETISDPTRIDEAKIEYWKSVIKVSNTSMRFAQVLPRNTIIAQRIYTGVTAINRPMFFLPFFPSHLSLPCKPGEIVWTMFENPNARIKEIGFWFCKVAAPHFIDDVNHTHFPQQLDHSFNSTIIKQMNSEDQAVYELQNGKVNLSKDGTRFVVPGSEMLTIANSSDELAFETLITESDASRITSYEPVPRFKKRPGDVALEGSNNTLVVLGTDRFGPIANFEEDLQDGFYPNPVAGNFFDFAGSIDIVAGRGTTEMTGGKSASVKSLLDGNELHKTLEKHKPVADEGDPDFINDRSRILVSQRTLADRNFGIEQYLTKQYTGVADNNENGDAAVVIKSDKVRIIARSDISFIVTGYVNKPREDTGVVYKEEKRTTEDIDNWASITIRQNGDIIFTPGNNGIIKLGGEDANQAILCTNRPADVVDGEVEALPIATDGGGFIGTSGGNIDEEAVALFRAPDLGTFSTKVLIK